MKEKIKYYLKENWLKFLLSYIGIYLILWSFSSILFKLQTPDLLRLYSQAELSAYTNIALMTLQTERQTEFLTSYLLWISLFMNMGLWLILVAKCRKG